MLITLRGLLSADAIEGEESAVPEGGAGWWPPRMLRPFLPVAVPLLTVAFVAAAAFSTLLPLRQAAVGPDYHLQEMLQMRPIVDGQNVLFLGRDNFVSWELIGSEVYAPITNHYDVEEVPALYRATDLNAKFDWDNVPPPVMNRFDWVVTTSAADAEPGAARLQAATANPRLRPLAPRPPGRAAPHPVRADQSRARRSTARDPGEAKLQEDRRYGDRLHGAAGRRPGLAPEPGADPDRSPPSSGSTSPPGAGTSRSSTRARRRCTSPRAGAPLAAPFDASLRTNLLFRGPSPYYPVGTLEVKRPGEVVFDVSVDDPPLVGRLLHTESKAYLTGLAATRADPPRQPVALSRACGRYVDWYEVAPGTPPSALQGVPAPHPQPVEDD